MSYTIAVAGKGGTGKTTISALLVRLLIEKNKGPVLAVDADPNSNLAEALGVKTGDTIGEILDSVAAFPEKIPSGMAKERFIEMKVQEAIEEQAGFDLLSMGRPEGPGCYCYANNILRNIIAKLLGDYSYVIIDNEAGLEHLSRRTTRQADLLLVISDATPAGLRAAERISGLAADLKLEIKNKFLLLNRNSEKLAAERLKPARLAYLGIIPQDEQIARISLDGGSLLALKATSPAIKALRKLDKLWPN